MKGKIHLKVISVNFYAQNVKLLKYERNNLCYNKSWHVAGKYCCITEILFNCFVKMGLGT